MGGLFGWFTRRKRKTPWVEEEDFIETLDENSANNENNINNMDIISPAAEIQHPDLVIQGRKDVDDFLNTNFEPQGYTDALINPDSSNATTNKEILKYQLELKIERVLTIYESKIKDYDFHIKTRSQNGMMDTVDEVQAEKEKILEEIKKIKTLQDDARENKGKGHVIILSYERGFKRGLAALTAARLFGKNLNNG